MFFFGYLFLFFAQSLFYIHTIIFELRVVTWGVIGLFYPILFEKIYKQKIGLFKGIVKLNLINFIGQLITYFSSLLNFNLLLNHNSHDFPFNWTSLIDWESFEFIKVSFLFSLIVINSMFLIGRLFGKYFITSFRDRIKKNPK